MRDILEEFTEGDGPMQRAQRGMRPVLPKRFFKEARGVERDGAFVLELDGKTARTPAKNLLFAPNSSIGNALAAEWNALGDTIDPAQMPLTRLLNVAIDRVAENADIVAADIASYAGSDLVCYRAGEPEGLVAVEAARWDPVLDWARDALGARFALAEGIRYVEQAEASVAAVRAAIDKVERPFGLAALATVTALTGSVLIALMLAHGKLPPEAAWNAGHVDEDWNFNRWREDSEAMQRRAARRLEFDAAARVVAAL